MEKRTRWLIVAVLIAQILIMAVAPVAAGTDAPAGAYEPGSITLDSATVHEIAVLGEQMQGYLALDKDGTLSLGEIDSLGLNVPDQYLENYKAALQYINAAIAQGLFTVDENFQVSWPEEADIAPDTPEPETVEPDWYGVPTSHGMYVNFSHSDVQYYLPNFGMSTALSLAAYSARPFLATPYTYHFTYYRIYRYYYWYSYPYYGVWSYVSWYYLPYYSGYYYPGYRYIHFWYPYGRYWYYHWCYW